MESWAFYDPKGKGKITIDNILFFIVDLEPPFGQHSGLKVPIKPTMDLSDFLVNERKNYCVKRIYLLRIVKDYKLKAVKDVDGNYYVLFSDIYKEFIKKAFEHYNF